MLINKEQINGPKQAVKSTSPSDLEIASRAYEIWLASGKPVGNDRENWFEAKRQLQSV
jgi:Protein of unknown function (DUF2934)